MALTFDDTLLPLTTIDASIKSSSLEFVHEPIKTRSIGISVILTPGLRSMYCKARVAAFTSLSLPLAYSSGYGIVSVTSAAIEGLVPQVTWGAIVLTSIVADLSK